MSILDAALCPRRYGKKARQHMRRFLAPVLLAAMSILMLSALPALATPFRLELVDSGFGEYGSGKHAAIAVTLDGTAHFACATPIAGFIRYKSSPGATALT